MFDNPTDGADVINNASSDDIVNLYDVSLSDITAAIASGNKFEGIFFRIENNSSFFFNDYSNLDKPH